MGATNSLLARSAIEISLNLQNTLWEGKVPRKDPPDGLGYASDGDWLANALEVVRVFNGLRAPMLNPIEFTQSAMIKLGSKALREFQNALRRKADVADADRQAMFNSQAAASQDAIQ